MTDDERWRGNWRVVSPAGAIRVDLARSFAKRRTLRERVRDLPEGTPVVLVASAPGAIRRCRTFATEADIELEREYLAFPSAVAPAYLVEDAPAPLGVFVRTVLAFPFRSAWSAPIEAVVTLLRALSPWRLMRAIAPGRIVVGRRG